MLAPLLALFATTFLGCRSADDPELLAFASLPADSFVGGPTTGQFIQGENGRIVPFENSQPVLGLSAIVAQADGSFLVLPDNGFGAQDNSPDFVLAVYRLQVDFRTAYVGRGRIVYELHCRLRDPDNLVDFPIVADREIYPDSDIPVDASIRDRRLLTGGDFDVESMRVAPDGTIWLGDEFGPFLLHVSSDGVVLGPPISLPGVHGPQNPYLPEVEPNLPSSGGFEGLAISPDGSTLYPMLEKSIAGQERVLNIYEFDIASESYTRGIPLHPPYKYRLEEGSFGIGDVAAISDDRLIIIERDALEGPAARLKKIFEVQLGVFDAAGNLAKTERIDLLAIPDPNGIATTNSSRFRYAFENIEAIDVTADGHWVIVNDNNYPFNQGRIQDGEPADAELIVVGTGDFGL